MPDYYLLSRAEITSDYITAHRAHELYAEAQSEPEACLRGDVETGFYFWSVEPETGLRLICYSVIPAHTDGLPADIRERLDAPPEPR